LDGNAKFGGAGSDGTGEKFDLPKNGNIDVYDKWEVKWTYECGIGITTSFGELSGAISGISVIINGRKEDAFKVNIKEE
jgi:hypothetical protein